MSSPDSPGPSTHGEGGSPSSVPKKPDNIVFLIIPTTWRDRIKRFNKNVSTLKFIRGAETPACLKNIFGVLDRYFQCTERDSSVGIEIASGIVSFVSCMFLLAVIPNIMNSAGYSITNSTAVVSLVMGIGNILSGVISNLPIIIGPSTPVSAYFASNVLSSTFSTHQANMVVVYTGIFFLIMAVVAPIGRFCARIIPEYIQISTSIGVGLVSTLAGVTNLGLVKQGSFSLLEFGALDAKSMIGLSTILVIAISVVMKSKIAHIRGLAWGTFVWWASQNSWPKKWTTIPSVDHDSWTTASMPLQIELVFEMFFLLLLTVFGLCKSLCMLGNILTKDGMVPNGRYLSIVVGLMNILSGCLYGFPVTVIADSAAGVRVGAKTGLSSVVAGLLFLLAIFFGPLYASIPETAYAPILIMTGIVQFKNIQNLDFNSRFILPAFMCFTLIPFTNSIFAGLGIGMACYLMLSFLTGQFVIDGKIFLAFYFPDSFGADTQTTSSSPDGSKKSSANAIELSNVVPNQNQDGNGANTSQHNGAADIDSSMHRRRSRRNSVMIAQEVMTSTEMNGGDVKGLVVGV